MPPPCPGGTMRQSGEHPARARRTKNCPPATDRRISVDEVKNFIINFLSVFYEAMPFVVLGAIIAGILEEVVPQTFFARVVPKNRILAIAMSSLLGIIFPMCECGIVPIMRRLLKKGLPLGCCIAYMTAGPIINVVVILSTWVAFAPHRDKGGMQIIFLRVGLAYVVSFVTALVVGIFSTMSGVAVARASYARGEVPRTPRPTMFARPRLVPLPCRWCGRATCAGGVVPAGAVAATVCWNLSLIHI